MFNLRVISRFSAKIVWYFDHSSTFQRMFYLAFLFVPGWPLKLLVIFCPLNVPGPRKWSVRNVKFILYLFVIYTLLNKSCHIYEFLHCLFEVFVNWWGQHFLKCPQYYPGYTFWYNLGKLLIFRVHSRYFSQNAFSILVRFLFSFNFPSLSPTAAPSKYCRFFENCVCYTLQILSWKTYGVISNRFQINNNLLEQIFYWVFGHPLRGVRHVRYT